MVTVRPLVPEDYPVVKEIVAEAFGADLPPDTIRPFAKDLQRYVAESCYRQVKKTGTAYVK